MKSERCLRQMAQKKEKGRDQLKKGANGIRRMGGEILIQGFMNS